MTTATPPLVEVAPVSPETATPSRQRVLIIDDVRANAVLLRAQLAAVEGIETVIEIDPERALELVVAQAPDLILVDFHMPQMSGAEFTRRVRAMDGCQDLPIVIVTADDQRAALYEALEAGAQDFLRKPVDALELQARSRNMLKLRARQLELGRLNQQLEQLAITDGLTGVANRRYFMLRLEEELERSYRLERPLSLLLLDADHFKSVNDTYGHGVGDLVLKLIADRARAYTRRSDLVGRIGGEEFAVLLPETSLAAAAGAAERVRHAVERGSQEAEGTVPRVTLSGGLTAWRGRQETSAQLLARADELLYRAKRLGRNRVEVG